MKRIKYILLTLILLIPINSKAAVFHCSAPSSVESGETFTVTFSGNLSSLSTTWSGLIVSEGNASYSSGSLNIWKDGPSFSQSVSFTAGNPGSATFYVGNIDVSDENQEYSGSDTCTVTITNATRPNGGDTSSYNNDNNDDEVDENKASNNFLKSLSIDGVKINPTFNKEKLDYTAVVSGDKDKISIKGEVEDEKASIEGLGDKELKEGINKFEIKVTAENGEVKIYTISVTRKEKDPIEVTINKIKYTVAKKDIGLKVPEGFTKTTVVIDKQEVFAYSNKFTGYLLVALVDEDGNPSWYIYNEKNSTYTKYFELKSNSVRLIILKSNKKDIPHRYKKITFYIDGESIDGYALEYNSSFRLVYGLNMSTGEKGFYLYDIEENTFQRFYNSQVEIYRSLLKKLEIGIIGLLSIICIMFIVIISQIVVNKKTKRFVTGNPSKEDIDLKKLVKEEEKHDKEEENMTKTKTIIKEDSKPKEIIDESKPLTRSELKRQKKEEKKRLEKERREFFN